MKSMGRTIRALSSSENRSFSVLCSAVPGAAFPRVESRQFSAELGYLDDVSLDPTRIIKSAGTVFCFLQSCVCRPDLCVLPQNQGLQYEEGIDLQTGRFRS